MDTGFLVLGICAFVLIIIIIAYIEEAVGDIRRRGRR